MHVGLVPSEVPMKNVSRLGRYRWVALAFAACATAAACDSGAGDDAALVDGGGGADGASTVDGGDPPAGGLGHPFGTHSGYHGTGVRYPGNHTRAELDAATAAFYTTWKSRYLEPACIAGQYRVKTTPATAAYTVSEGHGYGMLLAVLMAGHDPDARQIFDGLHAYYVGHPSPITPGLMAWAQDQSCQNVSGSNSATDGDLDIAYALLLAHRQWGSTGAVDYAAAARTAVAGVLAGDIHPSNSILLGDWVSASDSHYTGTRSSDFLPGHFKAYAAASGSARFTAVVDRLYATVAYLQTNAAPSTGLLPDFVINATGATPGPAPAGWLEGARDGAYGYNACRDPWRLATDYLMTGDVRAQAAVRKINTWIRTTTGDDPGRVRDGYTLAGQATGSSATMSFVAPFAVSAMVDPATGTNGPWLDALWDRMVAAGPDGYYGDSIKLLSMIVVSGNWFTP